MDSPLAEPLRHNAWATLRLLEASQALTPEQLAATVPGTFGSVLATLQHIIRSEGFYQFLLSGRTAHHVFIDEETVVQISTVGPWGLTYVNPKDDPRQKTQ